MPRHQFGMGRKFHFLLRETLKLTWKCIIFLTILNTAWSNPETREGVQESERRQSRPFMISRLALPLLAATLAFGQSTGNTGAPPSPATLAQMRVNRLSQALSLTDAQKTSALSIFTTSITNAQSIQSNLRTNQTSLGAAIKSNDTATIDSVSSASGALQAKLMDINARADAAFYQLLTADQKAIFDAMPHGGPGGRGPGGPGGAPGAFGRGRRGQ